jgi:hypothetical protein
VVPLTSEMLDYLTSSERPKQVLVTVHTRSRPRALTAREGRLPRPEQSAEQNRQPLIEALHREQERDGRVQFNPLAAVDQIAIKAPGEFIVQIATRPDVADIVLDEPEKVLDDPPADEFFRGIPDNLDI